MKMKMKMKMKFLSYFFMESSPVPLPFDFLPEGSPFFLDKDLDFWISFMIVIVVSIFGLLRLNKEMKEYFLSRESSIKKSLRLVFVLFILRSGIHLLLALAFQPKICIAYCDGIHAFSPPPSPAPMPEEPVAPQLPEEPVAPPVVIPQLAEPLIPDDTRRNLLYTRYLSLNLGGDEDLGRMVSIIDAQFLVERSVEAALVEDGFTPDSILRRYTPIRGILHAPRGGLLSPRTYSSYVTQIMEQGTRESVPYRRMMRAIQNNDILLDLEP